MSLAKRHANEQAILLERMPLVDQVVGSFLRRVPPSVPRDDGREHPSSPSPTCSSRDEATTVATAPDADLRFHRSSRRVLNLRVGDAEVRERGAQEGMRGPTHELHRFGA